MNKGNQHFSTRSLRMLFHFLITSVRVGNDSPEWQTGNIAIPLYFSNEGAESSRVFRALLGEGSGRPRKNPRGVMSFLCAII